MTAHPLLHGLDAEQREAVTTMAAPLAIVAAAGSGKTTVLTRRIAYRVAHDTALPQHVLALTFTRDAAAELKRRLRRLDIRDPIEAGTFHSIALRLLRDRALARNQQAPQLAGDRLRLAREVVNELKLGAEPYGALADLDWARARMVAPDRYEGACRVARRRSAVPAARYAEFVAAYERLKRRRGVVDFDDLLGHLLEAMRTDAAWAEGVQWRYRHFFVDEAQDLNPLQHAVLEALRGGRLDLCLVGDPRQAIYGWNGADPTTLAEVETRYPGVTVVQLTSNYRCSPQVVRAGAAALAASGQHDDTQSRQAGAAAVAVRQFANEHEEAEAVARHIRGLMHHRSGRDLAVLARTNDQLGPLQRALTTYGIATERTAGRSPLDVALATAFRCTNREQLAAWVDTVFTEGDEIPRRVAQEADRFLTSAEPGTFRAWVDARTPFDDLEPDDRGDAVALLTFHAAKGREWWGVVITGAEDGLVPHGASSSPAQLAEEARLFYVAITRAAQHLLVTHCAERNRRPGAPSRWLAAVTDSGLADEVVTPPPRPGRSTDAVTPYREWRLAVAKASGQSEQSVCSDRVLRSLAEQPPATTAELAGRLGITETAAARLRPLPDTA
ncbi:MAG: UvrD-helicase domain-containing protein [Actinomycetota bacterium]|nr:UvrD-helicase domain-containing protein [Actinomycetota bacterium]